MAKTVFEKQEAADLVVAYVPRKFPLAVSESAKSFVALQENGGGHGRNGPTKFQIERIVAEQTGIAEIERLSIEERIEKEALERLQTLQEAAYKEAYQLGLDEGRRRAYEDGNATIAERIERLDALLGSIEGLKASLAVANEGHLARLAFAIGSRLAMGEIKDRPELIIGVLHAAIEEAQGDERVIVRVSPEDKEFVEASRERLGRDADATSRLKFEDDASVSPGGCIIETNYGSVDATVERRAKKLWEAIAEKIPKADDVNASVAPVAGDPEKPE